MKKRARITHGEKEEKTLADLLFHLQGWNSRVHGPVFSARPTLAFEEKLLLQLMFSRIKILHRVVLAVIIEHLKC